MRFAFSLAFAFVTFLVIAVLLSSSFALASHTWQGIGDIRGITGRQVEGGGEVVEEQAPHTEVATVKEIKSEIEEASPGLLPTNPVFAALDKIIETPKENLAELKACLTKGQETCAENALDDYKSSIKEFKTEIATADSVTKLIGYETQGVIHTGVLTEIAGKVPEDLKDIAQDAIITANSANEITLEQKEKLFEELAKRQGKPEFIVETQYKNLERRTGLDKEKRFRVAKNREELQDLIAEMATEIASLKAEGAPPEVIELLETQRANMQAAAESDLWEKNVKAFGHFKDFKESSHIISPDEAIAKLDQLTDAELVAFENELKNIPNQVQEVLSQADKYLADAPPGIREQVKAQMQSQIDKGLALHSEFESRYQQLLAEGKPKREALKQALDEFHSRVETLMGEFEQSGKFITPTDFSEFGGFPNGFQGGPPEGKVFYPGGQIPPEEYAKYQGQFQGQFPGQPSQEEIKKLEQQYQQQYQQQPQQQIQYSGGEQHTSTSPTPTTQVPTPPAEPTPTPPTPLPTGAAVYNPWDALIGKSR